MRTGLILVAGLTLVGIAGLPLLNNQQKTAEFTQLYAVADSNLKELEQKKESLEYQVGLLEDEEYIAKLARHELNVSKPNEILINLPEEEQSSEEEKTDHTEENESE